MNTDTVSRKVHHGRNVKRLREMLGIKQEVIAIDLDITQQSVSELEQKEVIADSILEKIAKTLKVPMEAIKNMTDEATHNYINTFNEKVDTNYFNPTECTFNPLDKVIDLYERMLKEKNDLIEKLLNK